MWQRFHYLLVNILLFIPVRIILTHLAENVRKIVSSVAVMWKIVVGHLILGGNFHETLWLPKDLRCFSPAVTYARVLR